MLVDVAALSIMLFPWLIRAYSYQLLKSGECLS
jgi:hypothetical protein